MDGNMSSSDVLIALENDDVKDDCVLDSEIKFVNLNLSGRGLAAMDYHVGSGRSSDPYLILKQSGNILVRTEAVQRSVDPEWKRLHLHLQPDLPIEVEVWDWDHMTQDDLIGTATVSFDYLTMSGNLIQLKAEGKTAGFIQV